jgi:quercetin dioxygenase-like cupin family protein
MNGFSDVIAAQQTLVVQGDDIPWVKGPGWERRILQARVKDNMLVTQDRFHPGFHFGLHRHLAPVLGYTLKGAWSHEATNFPYVAGSYIYEQVNNLHRFYNGPEVSEVIYVQFGDVEVMESDGKTVASRSSVASDLAAYFQRCEEQGIARPNILG